MKIIKPDYYDDFKCAAGECTSPCCKAGWQIIIDDETLNFYNSCGDKFKKNIINANFEPMFRYEGSACAFFDNDGLCEIQRNFGHDRLCRTCRVYPRYEYTFGGLKEKGLELSCPTVAKILMDKKYSIHFKEEITTELPEPNEIEPNLYLFIQKCRNKSLEIVQNRNENLHLRIQKLLGFNLRVCAEIKNKTYLLPEVFEAESKSLIIKSYAKYFRRFEVLTNEWREILNNLPKEIEINSFDNEIFFENLLVYFIYRYYLLSVYDRKIIGKVRFAVLSTALISWLSKNYELDNPAVLYSREIEHSDENIRMIIQYLENHSLN